MVWQRCWGNAVRNPPLMPHSRLITLQEPTCFPSLFCTCPVWVQEKQFLKHPGMQMMVKQTVKLHFTATGPGFTKPISKEVVQGEAVSPEKGQATQQPWVQSARLLFLATTPSCSTKAKKATKSSDSGFFPHHWCPSLHFPVSCNT